MGRMRARLTIVVALGALLAGCGAGDESSTTPEFALGSPVPAASAIKDCLAKAGFRVNLTPYTRNDNRVLVRELGFQRGQERGAGGLLAIFKTDGDAARELAGVRANVKGSGATVEHDSTITAV